MCGAYSIRTDGRIRQRFCPSASAVSGVVLRLGAPMRDLLRSAVDAAIIEQSVEDYALHDVVPGAVVAPRSVDEAAAILRLANQHKWRVEFAGGMTRPQGNRRTRTDLVVTTRRLTEITEYEPADLVIGVQAGVTLDTLQREVGRNQQFLALDPPASEGSTVGGMIAAARSGPLRMAFGTPRDQVLGLQMLTADGRLLAVGGRVVKNVAGYDLVRLMTGSAGTLGMITQAFIRLRPVPQADESMVVRAHAAAPLTELATFITQHNLEAVALELLDGWSLLIRLHGNQESVVDARTRIAAHCSTAGLAVAAAGKHEWQELAQAELDAVTVVRLADLPSRLPQTLQLAEKLVARAGADARVAAHAADGIVRVLLGDSDAESTAFAIGEARTVLGVSGGSVIVHSGSGELMRRVDAFGGGGNTLPLMTKLKQLFDPAGVLAPGRFVV